MADGDILPELYIYEMPWRLNERQGVRMSRSGFSQVTMMAEPFWAIEVISTWLERPDFQTFDGFLTDRQGAASTFLASRHSMPYGIVPVASDVGLTVTAYDRAARTVSFGSTGAWTATKGDMLSFYTAAGGYWCGQAMETKAAAGSAMTALKVYPPPFEPHASLAAPRRIRALAEFQLTLPLAMPTERADERRVSFSANQIIRG